MIGGGCTATPGERVIRGIIAIFLIGFALSTLDTLWLAIPAAACAIYVAAGAVTGRSPSLRLPGRW